MSNRSAPRADRPGHSSGSRGVRGTEPRRHRREGGDDAGDRTTPAQTAGTTAEATAPSAPAPAADEIVVKGGKPEGGVQRVVVKKGDTVRLAGELRRRARDPPARVRHRA